MRDTMYNDKDIKKDIGWCKINERKYVPAIAQIALAKIAYNEMIETRIANEQNRIHFYGL